MPVDQNTLWLWKDIGMQELFDVLFFVKEKEHNFQKNKIIALLYLEWRERGKKTFQFIWKKLK